MHGHIAEKSKADRNEKRVYHAEYKKAAPNAAREDAPTRVAPKAPSTPSNRAYLFAVGATM